MTREGSEVRSEGHRVAALALTAFVSFLALVVPAHSAEKAAPAIDPVHQAVVIVNTYNADNKLLKEGVGFFISAQGHVITDFHVLRGAARAEVRTAQNKTLAVVSVVGENIGVGMVRVTVRSAETKFPFMKLDDKGVTYEQPMKILTSSQSDGDIAVRAHQTPHLSLNTWETGRSLQVGSRVPVSASGSPLVSEEGKLVGVVLLRNSDGAGVRHTVLARELSALKLHEAVPFADWAARYRKSWEEGAEGLWVKGMASLLQPKGRAAMYFQESVQEDPKFALGWIYLAAARVELDQQADAEKAIAQAVKLDPSNPLAWLVQGLVCSLAKQRPQEMEAYQTALRLKPDFFLAEYCLGRLYYQDKRYEESVKAYRKALDIDPTFAPVISGYAWACLQLKRAPEAADAFEKVLRYERDVGPLHHDLAGALQDLGSHRLAHEQWVKAVTAAEFGFGYELCQAWWLTAIRLGQWPDAVEICRTAMEDKKDASYPYAFLAWSYLGLGRLSEAQEWFEKHRAAWDGLSRDYCGLGWIAIERGQCAEAVPLFEDAIKRKEDYVDAYLGGGLACLRLGRLREAANYLEKALWFEPAHAEAHYQLGLVRLEMGEQALALEQARVLRTLDTDRAGDLLAKMKE